MKNIFDAFLAFNSNAFSYIAYLLTSNMWYILIIAGAVTCAILSIKEEVAVTVREEQQII